MVINPLLLEGPAHLLHCACVRQWENMKAGEVSLASNRLRQNIQRMKKKKWAGCNGSYREIVYKGVLRETLSNLSLLSETL